MGDFTVFVVDDEPIIVEGLVNTYNWSGMGFRIVGTAGSGRVALEGIKANRPDVVLVDIMMKDMDGLSLIEAAKSEGLPCIFVIISAYREFEYAKKACELGVFAYLVKVFSEAELESTMANIRKILESRTAERELLTDAASKQEDFSKVLEIIDANLENPHFNITTLADITHFNHVYLGRLFKKRAGKSFNDYLSDKRITLAKKLLTNTELSISEISYAVGFGS